MRYTRDQLKVGVKRYKNGKNLRGADKHLDLGKDIIS